MADSFRDNTGLPGYGGFGGRVTTTDSKTGHRSISPRSGSQPQHTVQHGYPGIIRPPSAQGISHVKMSLPTAPGSLSILSSILRGPPPIPPGHVTVPQQSQVSGIGHTPVSSYRVCSPIRVITSVPGNSAGEPPPNREVSTQLGGLSPSHTPITLPPKKSLSPSMVVYTDKHSHQPRESTIHIVTQQRSPSQGQQRGQSQAESQNQAQELNLLSHLPFLQQTLQQGVKPHEGLFQQYKVKDQPTSSQKGSISEILARRSNEQAASHGTPQHIETANPRPAHIHRASPPPTHVSTIRRTPSPAHHQLAEGHHVDVKVGDYGRRDETAMNLSKPDEKHRDLWERQLQASKPQLEQFPIRLSLRPKKAKPKEHKTSLSLTPAERSESFESVADVPEPFDVDTTSTSLIHMHDGTIPVSTKSAAEPLDVDIMSHEDPSLIHVEDGTLLVPSEMSAEPPDVRTSSPSLAHLQDYALPLSFELVADLNTASTVDLRWILSEMTAEPPDVDATSPSLVHMEDGTSPDPSETTAEPPEFNIKPSIDPSLVHMPDVALPDPSETTAEPPDVDATSPSLVHMEDGTSPDPSEMTTEPPDVDATSPSLVHMEDGTSPDPSETTAEPPDVNIKPSIDPSLVHMPDVALPDPSETTAEPPDVDATSPSLVHMEDGTSPDPSEMTTEPPDVDATSPSLVHMEDGTSPDPSETTAEPPDVNIKPSIDPSLVHMPDVALPDPSETTAEPPDVDATSPSLVHMEDGTSPDPSEMTTEPPDVDATSPSLVHMPDVALPDPSETTAEPPDVNIKPSIDPSLVHMPDVALPDPSETTAEPPDIEATSPSLVHMEDGTLPDPSETTAEPPDVNIKPSIDPSLVHMPDVALPDPSETTAEPPDVNIKPSIDPSLVHMPDVALPDPSETTAEPPDIEATSPSLVHMEDGTLPDPSETTAEPPDVNIKPSIDPRYHVGDHILTKHGHTFLPAVTKLSDEFKYGDLLQSIHRSQQSIQTQLHQQGLSPITPLDPSGPKPWGQTFAPQPQILPGRRLESIPTGIPMSSFALVHRSLASESSVNQMSSSLTPITVSASSTVAPVTITTGFVPVMLPSQHIMSPSRRSPSPKSRPVASSGQSRVENVTGMQPVIPLVRVPSPAGSEGVRLSHAQNTIKYSTAFTNISVTQAGPPNVTITSHSNLPVEKPSTHVQRNPFTFPATPPVSLTNENVPFGVGVIKTEQSKLTIDNFIEKQRHSSDEMPCLVPVSPFKADKKPPIKLEDVKIEAKDYVKIPQPYNMRLQTLNNFPNNSTCRPTYRATSVAIHRAKAGCITSTAKSLDILRQNLQKSINKEIHEVIQKYLDKFFKIGIENIKLNNGETSVTDDHMQAVCRQMLEEAKKMYVSDTGRRSTTPTRDLSDVSEGGSNGRRSAMGKRRHPSDTDSEANHRMVNKKKKNKHITGRSTPSKLSKEQYKREGPKYEPERLTEETQFIMGSRANKAMGFGATRGRLYMKHQDLFKYNGDQDDKTWLYENHHMPATGGKSYLIVLGDLKELAQLDEYQNNTLYNIDELTGFTAPIWMIEKMRLQMMSMRTDLPKQVKNRSRSVTPNDVTSYIQQIDSNEAPKDLPFANFSSPKPEHIQLQAAEEADDDMEFLSAAGTDDPNTGLSPFNMTGGFDDTASPSDLDNMEEETTIEPSFGFA